MSEVIIIFMLKMAFWLAIFLMGAYFLFRHIEKVKDEHGEPSQTQKNNYMDVLKHYFYRSKK